MRAATELELRRGALAVSVLHDVDLVPSRCGVTLSGTPPLDIGWDECRRALEDHDPESPAGRVRLAAWLLARRWCADAGAAGLEPALRPVGLPVDHVSHPGPDWVRERVLGDALHLGLGAVGLDRADPDRVVLVPVPALEALGIDPAWAWRSVRPRLEELGALAAERVRRDAKGLLRPFGDCDVVTLLGARSLRSALAADGGGLGVAVVPMRTRGWTRLALIDPAFGAAAAAATPAEQRGFPRPLLVTADELTLARAGGHPERIALRDAAADPPWPSDALYR